MKSLQQRSRLSPFLVSAAALVFGGAESAAGSAHCVRGEGWVGLANNHLALRLDTRTGALVSLVNRANGDEYLKGPTAGGNMFRGYINTKVPPPASRLGWAAFVGPVEDAMGGKLVDPADCELVRWTSQRHGETTELSVEMRHPGWGLLYTLKIQLADDRGAADCSLETRNESETACSIMTAFPYLTGLALGPRRKTNLGVRMFGAGLPGEPAWTNSGGAYGYQVSMQWLSVYEPSLNEGLAVIVMDPDLRSKIIRRFPGGGMSALFFPPVRLVPGQTHSWPSIRLLVHGGSWRVAARKYGRWFAKTFQPRHPPAWLDEVDLKSSLWIPRAEAVAKAKQAGRGAITSFTQVPAVYYLPNQKDMIEWAMYWDGMRVHPESFGAYGPDGAYQARQDLGGAEALRAAVSRLHELGRRVTFYVAGCGLRLTSDLLRNEDPSAWAIWRKPEAAPIRPNRHNCIRVCAGDERWQDQLATVCRRLLRETGADGIRLDELGMPYRPCFNPAHCHQSPYDGCKWHRELLRKVRAAMDEVRPDAYLTTEYSMDFFNESCNGALVMFYPGRDIEPMRVAIPTYRGQAYHPGGIECALNGWISGFTTARRRDWPWVIRPNPPPGFPLKPAGYGDFPGPELRWHELRATFAAATRSGTVTDEHPVAPADPAWLGRLWRTQHYWLLIGGHENGSALTGPTRVRLPELPEAVQHAYELDAATLAMGPANLVRDPQGTWVTVTSGFGVVLLPLPTCPPLLRVEDFPALEPGGSVTVALTALDVGRNTATRASATVAVPGLTRSPAEVAVPGQITIPVPQGTDKGYYALRVTGNCLPLKRWLHVKAPKQ